MEQISKKWTSIEVKTLKKYYALGPTALIKMLPGRSYMGIVAKAHKLGISDNGNWTEPELKILQGNYYDLGPHKLQKLLPNRTYQAIVTKGKALGLITKDNIMWSKKEVDILRRYYPDEGSDVYKRLNNRSKTSIMVAAKRYGVSFNRTFEKWDLTEDELVYDFYSAHGEDSFRKVSDLLQILKDHGFHNHGKRTLGMKLSNFKYLEEGVGLAHSSLQSKAVYEKRKNIRLIKNGLSIADLD
jgi:hypothetical protein